jgi:hypothetical protein
MTKVSGTAEARGSSPDITAGIDVEWSNGTNEIRLDVEALDQIRLDYRMVENK